METTPRNEQSVSDAEIKESEPKIHTVYAYIRAGERSNAWNQIDGVMALFTDTKEPMALARLDNMFATEEEAIVPLHLYEREEDLPEEIRKRIRSDYGSERLLPMAILQKKEGMVYAVLPNTDSTEGGGYQFIWTLVTDPLLASRIAWGNGVSGSHAEVVGIPLNTFPLNEELRTDLNIRRGEAGKLTDELYA